MTRMDFDASKHETYEGQPSKPATIPQFWTNNPVQNASLKDEKKASKRVTVYMDEDIIKKASDIGDGNLSKGLRLLFERGNDAARLKRLESELNRLLEIVRGDNVATVPNGSTSQPPVNNVATSYDNDNAQQSTGNTALDRMRANHQAKIAARDRAIVVIKNILSSGPKTRKQVEQLGMLEGVENPLHMLDYYEGNRDDKYWTLDSSSGDHIYTLRA